MHKISRSLLLAVPAVAAGLTASGTAHAADIGQTYSTPGEYTFTVPAGVSSLNVRIAGAGGGHDAGVNGCVPGGGGVLSGQLPVVAGQSFHVTVGGAGGDSQGVSGGAGGSPTGGTGGSAGAGGYGGGGGGGESSVILKTATIVAGGGGGCGGSADGQWGDGGDDDTAGGGGNVGADGQPAGGGAIATQAGGVSSPQTLPAGQAGDKDEGGAGADGPYLGGGGGGGGELGGGGGGGTALNDGIAGGGAGGSDIIEGNPGPNGVPSLRAAVGAQSGDGVVALSWTQTGTGVGDLFAPTASFDADDTVLGDGGSPLGQLPGDPSWTVPNDGVITSWAYEAGPDAPSGIELKVAQASSGGDQIVGGASSSATIAANSISTFPARIPVKAGEEIGAAFAGTSDLLPVPGAGVVAAAGDQGAGEPAEPYTPITPAGGPWGYDVGQSPGTPTQGAALPIEVFVEPDADQDGFGDTTQDRCPGVYGSDQGCPVADLGVSSSGLGGDATAGDTLSETFTVTDHGPDPVPNATLTDDPGAGAAVVSATPSTSGGHCTTGPTADCTLGVLDDGDSVTVRVLLHAVAAGELDDTATVAGPAVPAGIGAGDPNPANDSVSDTVTVSPAPTTGGGGSAATGGGGSTTGAGSPTTGGVSTPSTTAGGPGSSNSASSGGHAAARFSGARLRLRGPITATGRRATLTITSAAAARGTVVLTASAASAAAGRRPRIATVRVANGRFAVAAVRPGRVRVLLSSAALTLLRADTAGIRVRVTVTSRADAGGSAGSVTTRAAARLRLTHAGRR